MAYTHAIGVDRPQSVIRMGYVSRMAGSVVTDSVIFSPFTITPLWEARGQNNLGMYPDLGFSDRCRTKNGYTNCVQLAWPGQYLAYHRPMFTPRFWHGTIHQNKQDATGLFYRRNRYYDGGSGRFTQEDPIGLAGGMNVYGFAAGDPVNYSDPFGLRPLRVSERKGLGDLCDKIDCDKVQVHDGMDIDSWNTARKAILGTAGDGTDAVTLGYHIFVAKSGMNSSGDVRTSLLVHELAHVGQYESNKMTYFAKGAWTQWVQRGVLGKNVYSTPRELTKPFGDYGFEQQPVIVTRCIIAGDANACSISPFQPR